MEKSVFRVIKIERKKKTKKTNKKLVVQSKKIQIFLEKFKKIQIFFEIILFFREDPTCPSRSSPGNGARH